MRSFALAVVMLASCQNSESHKVTETDTVTSSTTNASAMPTTTTSSSTAAPVANADVAWTKPRAWSEEPVVGMRKATYRIAKVSGDTEDATVSVIQAGGSVDENIERWKTQFDAPHDIKRNETKAGGLPVTIVEIHGLYTGGGMMVGESPNPRPSWGLVGAIVVTSSQPYFFKMLGPDKTIAASRADFQTLVDSIKPK